MLKENPILSRWYKLYNEPAPTEVKFEPFIASLGLPYRFQHLVHCKYILDYAFPDIKVCVELDGESHKRKKQIEHDEERRQFLEKRGWRIIRLWNAQVNVNPRAALNIVKDFINGVTNTSS